MKSIKTLLLAVTLCAATAFSVFAEIPAPKGSIIIGNEGYDIDLLFDPDYDAQISLAASESPESIFYNLTGEWISLFSGEIVQDFDSWPPAYYMNSDGTVTIYDPYGNELVSELKWTLSSEILIDGPDGDPSSENYILITFNKPLANAVYSSVLADLSSSGAGHFLSVDGKLGESNIAAVEWHAESPDELVLYISNAANIPSPSQISFKLKSDVIQSEDGDTLPPGYLDIGKTVTNIHYGE